MSAAPFALATVSRRSAAQVGRKAWLPVLLALIFIRFTSTSFMGGTHTQILVTAVWNTFLGSWHRELTGPVNEYCRKTGHFIGYGLVSLIFLNAWRRSAEAFGWVTRNWLAPFAAFLAIASTFTVACLDEFHQTFLPGRVGCLSDALIDVAGAIVLNAIFWALRVRSRRAAAPGRQPLAAV